MSEFLDEDDDIMDVDGPDDESDANIKPKSMSTQARRTTASVLSPSVISFFLSLTSVLDFSNYHYSQGSSSPLKEGKA
jgi:hypothetical protein